MSIHARETDVTQKEDLPFQGGSQPVPENPPEVPGPGRSAMQYVVIAIAVLVVLAGFVFFIR